MNYELAKQLKDAGFISHEGKLHADSIKPENERVIVPTLSELIEAFQGRYKYNDGLINDAQFVLRKTVNTQGEVYIACLDGEWENYDFGLRYSFISPSPEEAVARLWLELQKHDRE